MPPDALLHGHTQVLAAGESFLQQRQLVVVRREQRARADPFVQMFDRCPCQRKSVICCSSAAHLIQQHKAAAVAVFRIAAVSVISTMKVDRPRATLSLAPMRV